ncbi:MAG: glycosyltransferase family 2 protein, partial [Desulfovibrionaceae bacterium]|nr:glycosyltransferase family 2 protein [Desulfovibrionaceae bacterium]
MRLSQDIRCCVLVPVYNPGSTLRAVVLAALERCPDVLVVDDGSTDGGPAQLADLPVTVIAQPANRGKGAAIRRGAGEARAMGFTHVIVMDADGQHSADDLPAFFEAVRSTPCALVIGARDFSVPNVPKSSRFGRRFSSFWMFVQTGLSVSDMQSGFRAYPLALLEAVPCSE